MKFDKQLSSLISAAILCGTFTSLSIGQQTAGAGVAATAPSASAAPANKAASEEALLKSTPPLTEDALRARYVG